MYQNNYNLNFVPGGVPLTIHISQYDVGTRTFHFTPIAVPGTVTAFTGATATLEATKPDGYAVIQECTYNGDGTIDYTVQEQLAAKAGKVWSKIVLRDGTDVIGTAAIVWIVDKAGVTDGAVISDSDVGGLERYISDLRKYVSTPVPATTVSEMTDTEKIYLYTGNETGYTSGNWYYYNGAAWVSGGVYGGSDVEVDSALSSSSTNPVQNKVITGEITELKDEFKLDTGYTEILHKKYTHTGSGTYWQTNQIANPAQYKKIYLALLSTSGSANTALIVNVVYGSPSSTQATNITSTGTLYEILIPDDTINVNFRLQHGSGTTDATWDVLVISEPISIGFESLRRRVVQNNNIDLGFKNGSYFESGFSKLGNRICSDVLYFPYPVTIITDMKISVFQWKTATPETLNDAVITRTLLAWGTVSLAPDTYYSVVLAKLDDSDLIPTDAQFSILKDEGRYSEYSYKGEFVPTNRHTMNIKRLGLSLQSVSDKGVPQGLACDANYIYVFYTNGYVQFYNKSTYAYITGYDVTMDHCNTVSFDNGYLYAFDTSNLCYVVTINTSNYNVVRRLKFADGYYTYGIANNNKLYTIAYAENSYRDDTDNYMICHIYDLTDLTDNGDGTYTPASIKAFNLPFIYSIQDMAFLYGKIYAISSYLYSENPTHIYGIDYDAEEVVTDIDNLNSDLLQAECEGIDFYDRGTYYTMIISTTGAVFELVF